MDHSLLMQHAIDAARHGIEAGQSPFGCAIALGDRLITSRHNIVLASTDITAHAEVTALREACRQIGSVILEGCTVASTCEPCPMCMAALHWARVDEVCYGATIQDAAESGFNELHLPAEELLRRGRSRVKRVPGVMVDACRQLFQQWHDRPDRQVY